MDGLTQNAPSLPAGDGLTGAQQVALMWAANTADNQGLDLHASELRAILAAPQRQAAGDRLTDEQILAIYRNDENFKRGEDCVISFARAILAAHSADARNEDAELMRDAAMRTVQAMGLQYTPGADRWKPVFWKEDARNMVEGVASDRCRYLLAALVDIHDDAWHHSPEHRTYEEGAFKATLDEARELLAAPAAPAPTEERVYYGGSATPEPVSFDAPAPAAQADDSVLWSLNRELGAALSEARRPIINRQQTTALMQMVNVALSQQSATPAGSTAANFDDYVVEQFAVAMKRKLAAARAKGRGGWQYCTQEDLSRMLREHVEKGDARDVANFCMFLWYHGHAIVTTPADAASEADKRESGDAYKELDLSEMTVERADDESNGVFIGFLEDDDDTRLDALMDALDSIPDMPAYRTADFDGVGIIVQFEAEEEANAAIDALTNAAIQRERQQGAGDA